MAYTRLDLKNGAQLDESHFSHIEDGIIRSEDSCTIKPFLEYGAFTSAGELSIKYYDRKYYRTSKYLRPASNKFTITTSVDCESLVFFYDKDFKMLSKSQYFTQVKDVAQEVGLAENCIYIRIFLRKNANLDQFALPELTVTNMSSREYFNLRPESGYHKLAFPVQLTNTDTPTTTDWVLEDSLEFAPTYGILALPKTYSNTGKPTRLIIYCHGAGGRYTDSSTTINADDCDPNYWLAEGYAVLDVDGGVWSSTIPSLYVPEARISYENAYRIVVNSFNICTDGIFLGGRSMGGTMCMQLVDSNIPVLAASVLAGSLNPIAAWFNLDKNRANYWFERFGFEGEKPATISGSYAITEAECDYIFDNFDKWYPYTGAPWKGVVDLPTKEEMYNILKNTPSGSQMKVEAETELFANRHAKCSIPIKFFNAYEDSSAPYERNAALLYRMLKNGGSICEQRLVHTNLTGSTAHRFELKDSRAYINHTTIYGETVSAPMMYVEMLQFWRRYEHLV